MNAAAYSDEDDLELMPLPGNLGTPKPKPKHWWTGRDATQTRKEVLCPGHQHDVGLIHHRTDDGKLHLAFRLHSIVTAGGWKIPCSTSLKFACQVEIPNRPDVECPHAIAERHAVAKWNDEAAARADGAK